VTRQKHRDTPPSHGDGDALGEQSPQLKAYMQKTCMLCVTRLHSTVISYVFEYGAGMTLPDQHVTDPTDFVRGLWYSDGLHTCESITAAATAIEELTRYLAHATRGDLDVPTLYSATGSLAHAASISEQVLTQLAGACTTLSARTELRHDAPDTDPASSALFAADTLGTEATSQVRSLRQRLDQAQQQLGHLYVAGNDE
jgi:hypothetical protein